MRERSAAASRTTSCPATRALPASGSSSVARMRTAVVFPAPLGPRRPSTLPVRAAKSTPHRARTDPYDFSRPSTSIASSFMRSTLAKGPRDFGSVWHTSPTVSERRPRPKLVERLEARRATHRERSRSFRIAFGAAGALVLVGGLVMLVTPGPAFVLIPIGLAMLSMEFVWAAVALEKALEQAQVAQEKAARTSTTERAFAIVAGTLALAAAVAAAIHFELGPF